MQLLTSRYVCYRRAWMDISAWTVSAGPKISGSRMDPGWTKHIDRLYKKYIFIRNIQKLFNYFKNHFIVRPVLHGERVPIALHKMVISGIKQFSKPKIQLKYVRITNKNIFSSEKKWKFAIVIYSGDNILTVKHWIELFLTGWILTISFWS